MTHFNNFKLKKIVYVVIFGIEKISGSTRRNGCYHLWQNIHKTAVLTWQRIEESSFTFSLFLSWRTPALRSGLRYNRITMIPNPQYPVFRNTSPWGLKTVTTHGRPLPTRRLLRLRTYILCNVSICLCVCVKLRIGCKMCVDVCRTRHVVHEQLDNRSEETARFGLSVGGRGSERDD